MSEKEASSLAAELSREDDLPPLRRLKNDLRVAVQVLRVEPEKTKTKSKIFLHHYFHLKKGHFYSAAFNVTDLFSSAHFFFKKTVFRNVQLLTISKKSLSLSLL